MYCSEFEYTSTHKFQTISLQAISWNMHNVNMYNCFSFFVNYKRLITTRELILYPFQSDDSTIVSIFCKCNFVNDATERAQIVNYRTLEIIIPGAYLHFILGYKCTHKMNQLWTSGPNCITNHIQQSVFCSHMTAWMW